MIPKCARTGSAGVIDSDALPSIGPIHLSAWRRRARGLASDRATSDQFALLIAWVHDANRLNGRARAGDREVGKVGAWGIDEGLEVSIYVVPELRRRGVGMRMLAALPSACAGRWPNAKEIASLKRFAEKVYRTYRSEGPGLDCGSTILKWLNGRASHAAGEFNAAAELLEKHDSGVPKGFRL